jgi:putative endonuclease
VACFYLFCKGYHILGVNIRTPVGEMDLLTKKGHCLIVFEIKAYKTHNPEAIKEKQKRRITRALQYYIHHRSYEQSLSIRFDVLLFSGYKWPRHIKNAWQS